MRFASNGHRLPHEEDHCAVLQEVRTLEFCHREKIKVLNFRNFPFEKDVLLIPN